MATQEESGKGVRLGVSPLSWSNDVLAELGGDVPLEVCLQDAAEIGYTGVELGRKFPREAAVLQPILANYGLQLITGWHSGFLAEHSVDAEWKAVTEHLRLLQACGCRVLVYGECALLAGPNPWDEALSTRPVLAEVNLPQYAGRLAEFSRRLQQEGLQLAYHYHLKMLVETGAEIKQFCEATDPVVGLLLDTGHAYAAGADYAEILRDFGSRVVHVHLKDVRKDVLEWARREDATFNSAVRKGMFTVPGDGAIDFAPIGRFINSSGYAGWVVVEAEQDPAQAAPRQYTQQAYNYVQGLRTNQTGT